MTKFSVDTKLFRELGELLVGRESTALVELVKNSYDADATLVRVHGDALDEPDKGTILIEDNGVGMDTDVFRKGFLTIAGRTKVSGSKTSPRFGRRFTGEKGVGRLAAHKLGAHLDVTSQKWNGKEPGDGNDLPSDLGMHSTIDWAAIERLETFDDITDKEVSVAQTMATGSAGTRLTLSSLRRKWTKRAFADFYGDVATLVPSQALVHPLPQKLVKCNTLFDSPAVRASGGSDPGFSIEYSGAFGSDELDIPAVPNSAYWVIEIVCDAPSQSVKIMVSPTATALRNRKFMNAEVWSGTLKLSPSKPCVSFTARIFEKEGEAWPEHASGIKVYLEGFRIPPYGDANNDWLELDRDYRSRGKGMQSRLRAFSEWRPPVGSDEEGTDIKGNRQYFGAVFLTRDHSEPLQLLVNREGFLPNEHWENLIDVVRWAVGVQVRQRTMARLTVIERPSIDQIEKRRDAVSLSSETEPPSVFQAQAAQKRARVLVHEIKTAISAGRTGEASKKLEQLDEPLDEANRAFVEHASEATMFRVLASVGLEQAAFVHEILGLGLSADAIVSALQRMCETVTNPRDQKRLRLLLAQVRDLRERLKRNGVYLTEMTGIEGRRRRSRLKLRRRFEPVLGFFAGSAGKHAIKIHNEIPDSLVSPPIFPAEASALFSNLLSNAIKFAGDNGHVLVTGSEEDGEVIIRFENSGERVDTEMAEKWFDPFRTTTGKADPTLGQGMGLGLTVSRSLMDEYGGIIGFVTPSKGYATAIEFRWPKR